MWENHTPDYLNIRENIWSIIMNFKDTINGPLWWWWLVRLIYVSVLLLAVHRPMKAQAAAGIRSGSRKLT